VLVTGAEMVRGRLIWLRASTYGSLKAARHLVLLARQHICPFPHGGGRLGWVSVSERGNQ
jgi:hypothetical protein